jgi:hypothetical protein
LRLYERVNSRYRNVDTINASFQVPVYLYAIVKKYVLALALLLSGFSLGAQSGSENTLAGRIQAIEDRMAIKNVVDSGKMTPADWRS